VKIGDIHSYTQELIGGGEVTVTLIKLGPLICFMPIGMEHCGEGSNGRATKVVNNMICAPCFILDVEMELL
jgi:3-hydroxyisobutyrate dehydrogenase-like beta-hydroxyacid dehydrogenase